MPNVVYVMSAITSGICMFLLFRGYFRTRTSLLLWSSVGFAGLTANNILLVLDMILLQHHDLRSLRDITALVGIMPMILGLILES